MDKQTASGLIPFTNDPKFQQHFKAYIEDRESLLLDRLVLCEDAARLKIIQGSVQELRRMKTINDELINFMQTSKK